MTGKDVEWTVHSFVGLGPLRYGMTPGQILTTLGDQFSIKSYEENDGSIREYRGKELPICSYKRGRLVSIETDWQIESVNIDSVYLYRLSALECLTFLEKKNGDAKILFNLIIFNRLGVSMNGFYHEKEGKIYSRKSAESDQRRIGFYSRGGFDKYIERFNIISFI